MPEPSPASRRLPWGYLPLLWINQAFDGCTLILGASGRHCAAKPGAWLLGLAGAVLLLASATWFLKDWLGWQW